MARSEITGKRRMHAHNVSHSNIKTNRWQQVNVQRRRLWVPELNRYIALKVSTRDLRSITKLGLIAYAKKHGVSLG
jgi:large subunit ribosomal protein L28